MKQKGLFFILTMLLSMVVFLDVFSANITFADSNVKALCVAANWDTNGDGELSEDEAAAVTSLGNVFTNNTQITSFDELQYFTGLTTIGSSAFSHCSGLTSVTIPNNVTNIGTNAFNFCKNLATLTLPSSLITIDYRAFYGCEKLESLILPGSLESIGEEAFCVCRRLTTLTIPGSVDTIGEDAFSNCNNIEDLTISEGVKSIGNSAFAGIKITSINIPKSVTNINYINPFRYCRSLETITVDADNPNYYSQNNSLIERSTNTLVAASINTVIPNGIKIIGNSAFYGLPIETIAIPNTVTTIGNSAFSNCEELVSITIPRSVTKIDDYAFFDCPKIESIILSSGLKTIGNGAFETLSNYLTSMIIPEGVTSIGSAAFQECYALEFVSLPSSLTSYLNSVFYKCNNLSEVEINTTSPLIADQYSFTNRTNATLYVPAGSKAAYQAAEYWRDFENINEVGYIGDVNSELTGETGIACFAVNRTGKLGNYFVQAGRPQKVKIIGEVNANDLSNLFRGGYWYEMYYTTYLDISEAHINACTYGSRNCPDDYLNSEWLGGGCFDSDDENWYGPSTIVLPMTLKEFEGDAYEFRTLYSEQTTPFNTTITNYYGASKCEFHVPPGTRNSWIEMTTYPENVTFIDGSSKNVNIATAGTLAALLTDSEIATVNELSITGYINAKDFSVLKRMNNLVNLSVRGVWEAYEGNDGPVAGQTSYRAGEIPAYVFQNHSNLESISLYGYNKLSSTNQNKGFIIGDYAFDGCIRLNKFTCEGFSSLGDFCFRNTKVMDDINLLGVKYFDYEDDEEKQCSGNREFEHIGRQPFFGVEESYSSWNYSRFMCELFDYEGQMYGIYEMENFEVVPNYYSLRNYFSGVTNKAKTLLHAITTIKGYNLTLPASITTLADYAVSGLQIRSINLSSVTTLGDAFLYKCPLLQSITCNNTAYKSVDGVLYTADKKTLVKYPCAKTAEELIIPSTVEQIGKWAFEGTENLTTIAVKTATPPTLAELAFNDFDATAITLYVPNGSRSAYEAADGWNQFNIVEYVVNDVNMDGETDVVDVVDIARFVVGTPAETFVKVLADVNDNGEVMIDDAVVLVNEIAGDTNWSRGMRAPQRIHNDVLALTENEDNSLSLQLEGSGRYTAFQFDLYLTEDVGVTKMSLNSQRKQKHQLLCNKVREGQWRVVALSTSNREFEGVTGELLNIALDGFATDDVVVDNIHFVTAQGQDVLFDAVGLNRDGMTTKVDALPAGAEDAQTIYSLSGQQRKAPQKGLNIIGGKKIVIK